jgi:hypothetical protein
VDNFDDVMTQTVVNKRRIRKNCSEISYIHLCMCLAPTLSEDEDDGNEDTLAWDDSAIPVGGGSTPVTGSFVPAIGGPFSALTPSMWPQDILSRIQQVQYRKTPTDCNAE